MNADAELYRCFAVMRRKQLTDEDGNLMVVFENNNESDASLEDFLAESRKGDLEKMVGRDRGVADCA